ncbi:hypothetical protein BRYFOR_06421 [Marvinbryantia formatexigens DSM 14469]|uniref:LytR/CpsA/Psr regulator C-terminal domain-containing protein n=1 Tax=Marvinbryantia formatexigens DSM 14469 TaxID=478749 RepID=C6LCS4_9FIRM|nr:LytR C-terminal domain-containing protein [Marvinbryantia formatexigens]EET61738.1 hypothetical protein BRYFOR_06421 [Marvinbryantia formatexigens DSM 14469]UWO24451.1 LytR C-terminal domain-containing protein [Marvinbryantia formatexigens DSM 14469]SDF08327.1 LytR cell envelope-related transcriptional attenuator [Marvinbryantia formatexigens]
MRKWLWTVFLLFICIAGIAASLYLYKQDDRQGPVITVESENVTYYAGGDTSVLLKGVTAMDETDGDLTENIMIEAIYPSADGTSAEIIYAVMDKSNNVTKAKRNVKYVDESQQTQGETDAGGQIKETEPQITETQEASEKAEAVGRESELKEAKLAIINGSNVAGVAAMLQERFREEGFQNISIGSYQGQIEETVIYTENVELGELLKEYFPEANIENEMVSSGIDISVTLMDACIIVGQTDAEKL